jgi:hypothetical protein
MTFRHVQPEKLLETTERGDATRDCENMVKQLNFIFSALLFPRIEVKLLAIQKESGGLSQ